MYSGKGSALGVKGTGRANRWSELTLGKGPRVAHLAAGHDGQHAIILLEDGSVLFAGTARRGEDGDSSEYSSLLYLVFLLFVPPCRIVKYGMGFSGKARRQPKPVKPKKIVKVEGQFVIDAACNNGSTALVTKEGSLLMFGKDTTHCDGVSGVVTDLSDVHVVHVSLGKAHAVVLTNKGQVYTFGINNKGQCGRDFTTTHVASKEVAVVAMETGTGEDELIVAEEGELARFITPKLFLISFLNLFKMGEGRATNGKKRRGCARLGNISGDEGFAWCVRCVGSARDTV